MLFSGGSYKKHKHDSCAGFYSFSSLSLEFVWCQGSCTERGCHSSVRAGEIHLKFTWVGHDGLHFVSKEWNWWLMCSMILRKPRNTLTFFVISQNTYMPMHHNHIHNHASEVMIVINLVLLTSTLTWQRLLKSVFKEDKDLFKSKQWLWSQGLNWHGFDQFFPDYSDFSTERVKFVCQVQSVWW